MAKAKQVVNASAAPVVPAETKFYFICRTNPSAPALVLDHFWEAREMFNHPDYYEVDENGLPVTRRESQAPNQIPVTLTKRK